MENRALHCRVGPSNFKILRKARSQLHRGRFFSRTCLPLCSIFRDPTNFARASTTLTSTSQQIVVSTFIGDSLSLTCSQLFRHVKDMFTNILDWCAGARAVFQQNVVTCSDTVVEFFFFRTDLSEFREALRMSVIGYT